MSGSELVMLVVIEISIIIISTSIITFSKVKKRGDANDDLSNHKSV